MDKHLGVLSKHTLLTQKFAEVYRQAQYVPQREENDAEHSRQLGYICRMLNDELWYNFDVWLLLKYALAHDLPEIITWDIPLHTRDLDALANKEENEKKAMIKLEEEYPEANSIRKYSKKYNKRTLNQDLYALLIKFCLL